MFYNGDNKYDVAVFLRQVHTRLGVKYFIQKNLNTMEMNAIEMQKFLQAIRQYFEEGTVDNKIYGDKEIEYLENLVKSLGNNVKNFFSDMNISDNKHGTGYEDNMGELFLKIFNEQNTRSVVTGTEGDYGTKNANRFLSETINVIYDKEAQKANITAAVSNHATKYALGNCAKAASAAYAKSIPKSYHKKADGSGYESILQPVSRKVDIDNNKLTATVTQEFLATIPQSWQNAVSLLKTATFTVKNYKANENLKIGDTQSVRAFFSILDSIGFKDYKTVSSAFLHTLGLTSLLESRVKINKETKEKKYRRTNENERAAETALHVYHMRFTYELTGAGQKDANFKDLTEADYLLYNIHSGKNKQVYIIPTNKIIYNLFDSIQHYEDFGRGNPFKGNMYIRLNLLDRGLKSNYKG